MLNDHFGVMKMNLRFLLLLPLLLLLGHSDSYGWSQEDNVSGYLYGHKCLDTDTVFLIKDQYLKAYHDKYMLFERFEYDRHGHLLRRVGAPLSDEMRQVMVFEWDSHGNLQREISIFRQDTVVVTYENSYDRAGNLTGYTRQGEDGTESKMVRERDSLGGWVDTIFYNDGSTRISWFSNQKTMIRQLSSLNSGTWDERYDARGNLEMESLQSGKTISVWHYQNRYDRKGRLRGIWKEGERIRKIRYDREGREFVLIYYDAIRTRKATLKYSYQFVSPP